MDHHKKKNNTNLNPLSQIYSSSKKAIKILLTLSLFCILFSCSLFSSLFSTFSMKLLSYYYYSTDRNYIFLLCNGILILIIKNSGLFAIAPSNTDHSGDNYYAKKNVQYSHQSNGFTEYNNAKKNTRPNPFSDVSSSQTNEEEVTKAAVEVDKAERAIITFTGQVGENVTLIEEKEEEEEEEKDEEEFVNMEEEEGIELLSLEELNKKCEEFIRKMKYGIKVEAQTHHLIMVK